VFESEAVTVHVKDVHVVGEAIEQCAGAMLPVSAMIVNLDSQADGLTATMRTEADGLSVPFAAGFPPMDEYPSTFGSEGWGFESLRARQ